MIFPDEWKRMFAPTRRVEFCLWCGREVKDHEQAGTMGFAKYVVCDMAPPGKLAYGVTVREVQRILDQFGQPAPGQ